MHFLTQLGAALLAQRTEKLRLITELWQILDFSLHFFRCLPPGMSCPGAAPLPSFFCVPAFMLLLFLHPDWGQCTL